MNKKSVILGVIILLIITVVFGVYFLFFKPKKAGILIESTPTALVFIAGEQVGRTPYETTLIPTEVVVRLIPESPSPLSPYEVKVKLESGIRTVIRRDFGETDYTSAGEVISFTKIGSKETSLSVVTNPDSAQVFLDGQPKGVSPTKMNVSPGEHQLAIQAQGYLERTVRVKAINGYWLTVAVDLAESGEEKENLVFPEDEGGRTQEVKILETGTGFLRVRKEPTTASAEIGQVKPGEVCELLEEDEETGWYKIKITDELEGWVTNEYATKQGE